jgi:hypothetical protein
MELKQAHGFGAEAEKVEVENPMVPQFIRYPEPRTCRGQVGMPHSLAWQS